MKPNPVQATNAEGQQRPRMLQASELALDRSTALVQLAEARGLARNQRVQAVGLQPA